MCAKSSENTQLLKYKAGLKTDHYEWQDYFGDSTRVDCKA